MLSHNTIPNAGGPQAKWGDRPVLVRSRWSLTNMRARRANVTGLDSNTHTLPTTLLPPPDHWKVDFPVMAAEAGLSTPEHIMAFSVLDGFWKANSLGGT